MGRFRFRLEAVLELRRKRETEAKRALAEAQGLTRVAGESVAAAEDALRESQARALDELSSEHATTSAVWHRNWMTRLRDDLEAAQERLRERQANEAKAAERARAARRDVRALERLRQRAWQEYIDGELRAQQHGLDEFATLRVAAGRQARKELR